MYVRRDNKCVAKPTSDPVTQPTFTTHATSAAIPAPTTAATPTKDTTGGDSTSAATPDDGIDAILTPEAAAATLAAGAAKATVPSPTNDPYAPVTEAGATADPTQGAAQTGAPPFTFADTGVRNGSSINDGSGDDKDESSMMLVIVVVAVLSFCVVAAVVARICRWHWRRSKDAVLRRHTLNSLQQQQHAAAHVGNPGFQPNKVLPAIPGYVQDSCTQANQGSADYAMPLNTDPTYAMCVDDAGYLSPRTTTADGPTYSQPLDLGTSDAHYAAVPLTSADEARGAHYAAVPLTTADMANDSDVRGANDSQA